MILAYCVAVPLIIFCGMKKEEKWKRFLSQNPNSSYYKI